MLAPGRRRRQSGASASRRLGGGLTETVSGRVAPSKVLLVASFGAFLAFLDATIVNVAFPTIRESFPDSSIGALSWVLNAYNIVFAAFLVVCGRLTDLLGRRRAFVRASGSSPLASVLCAVAASVELLVAARVSRPWGRDARPGLARPRRAGVPRRRRAHAIGLWGATAAVAAGLGPPIGGVLVELGGWRWAFLVNLPFGLSPSSPPAASLVESRAPGRRALPDMPGRALLAAALALLTLGGHQGQRLGWTSWACWAPSRSRRCCGVCSSAAPAGTAPRWSTRSCSGSRRSRIGNVATILARAGLLRLPAHEHPVAPVRLGLRRAARWVRPGARGARRGGGGGASRADRRTGRLRVFVVPGALVWAGAYVWYHQMVGLDSGLLVGVAARSGALGRGVGRPCRC